MGTSSSSKRPTRRVRNSITIDELRLTNFLAFLRAFVFVCVFCAFAGIAFAQTQTANLTKDELDPAVELSHYRSVFEKGTVEEKRSALFEIRNLRSEIASRIALPALQDPDDIVRATAAFSVIYLPKDEAFNALVPNLQDKSEIVRRETAYALGKVQNANAVDPLLQTFQTDKSKEVKNACVVALGEIGDVAAIDFLTKILAQKPKASEDFLRRSAARSIGQIAQIIQIRESYTVTPESFLPEKYKLSALEKYQNLAAKFPPFQSAVPVLTRVLQNPKESADARREAAFALGTLGDVSATDALQSNLASKDYYLAEICKESLEKLSSVEKPTE